MLTSRFGVIQRNSNWTQHVRLFQPRRALPPDEPKLIRIGPGEFLMGSNEYDDERPPHRVAISRAFDLAAHEVTQGQYLHIMHQSPSHFKGPGSLPVEQVSWFDAVEFCNALSGEEGLAPYYRIEGTGDNRTVTVPDPTGNGYRLPTEAEWEYACRAGSTAKYSSGDGQTGLERYAWCNKNSERKTHPVGQKELNAFGLSDMHGNVWEWCWDWYNKAEYKHSTNKDPTGPKAGSTRVLRGGSWDDDPAGLRSANRFDREPSFRSWSLGFRIVKNLN
jgi:formylglycine-generating enzyme required for sulfatase activity